MVLPDPLHRVRILKGVEPVYLPPPVHFPLPAVLQQQAAVHLVCPELGTTGPNSGEAGAVVVHVAVGHNDALHRSQ